MNNMKPKATNKAKHFTLTAFARTRKQRAPVFAALYLLDKSTMNVLKLLFSFDGRITRTQFWFGQLGLLAAFILILFILVTMGVVKNQSEIDKLVLLVSFLFLLPHLAISIKRCHDRDKSGAWVIVSFIPVVGIFWFVIDLGFLKGTQGKNVYDQIE